ncbi:MAG: TNT domain-containing protein [Sporichthyaceae bacterium]
MKAGTRIDRYGREGGTFVSPEGTPFPQRSLPADSEKLPRSVYEVTGDLDVQGGITAPWFGQPGGGVQYDLPSTVGDLVSRGLLKRIG